MANLIEFPSRTVQGWAKIERTIRSLLVKANASTEMQEEVVSNMKEVFHHYNVKFSVPLELPDILSADQSEVIALYVRRAFADYERQLHDLMNNIMLERLQIEIELYRLRYEKGEGI